MSEKNSDNSLLYYWKKISAKILNYAKDYRLSPEGKIIKTEQKLLILNTEKEKNEILAFAHKMSPGFPLEELNQISFE